MLGAIWAQSRDGVIGNGHDMPWHVPEDLAHFKEVTHGFPVIMGRRTWESLPERFRPLPGRENLVLSRAHPGPWSEGATVIDDLAGTPTAEAWIIGGGQVYASTLEAVQRIEVTVMDATLGEALGDSAVLAPDIPAEFSCTFDSGWIQSEKGCLTLTGHSPSEKPLRYKFLTYERKDAA